MSGRRVLAAAALAMTAFGCGDSDNPASPSPQSGSTTTTIQLVFMGSTTRRSNLPASTLECVSGVGVTHTHPSWRGFAGIPLTPVPPDRYEIAFPDVPVNTRVSLRVNDQNSCDENPTGAVTRNVLVNGVRLVQNATTPGNGDEPGFAFTVSRNGIVSQ